MFALVAAFALAATPVDRTYAVETGHVTYHIVHRLHDVHGRSERVQGRAIVKPDGQVQAMARIPVATFDSGEGNRDAHMQEAVESGRYPFVVVKVAGNLPPGFFDGPRPSTRQVKLLGELDFHGIKSQIDVPLTVKLEPGGSLRIAGGFTFSLDQHRVQRPSLLMMKIDDECRIELELLLREEEKP